MSDAPVLELFTALICPYAHRTRLVLAEKNIAFDLTEIDFKNKPARFLEVSRYGKVPAIVHQGRVVYESAIVNEYLDEVFPEPAMMPDDPGLRAQARIWTHYLDNYLLNDHYAAIKQSDGAKLDEARETMAGHFRALDAAMTELGGQGPFFLGERIALLDCNLYPFFERLPAWTHYRGIGLPDDCRRLAAWRDTMAGRASVTEIANDADYYVNHYAGYANSVAAE